MPDFENLRKLESYSEVKIGDFHYSSDHLTRLPLLTRIMSVGKDSYSFCDDQRRTCGIVEGLEALRGAVVLRIAEGRLEVLAGEISYIKLTAERPVSARIVPHESVSAK